MNVELLQVWVEADQLYSTALLLQLTHIARPEQRMVRAVAQKISAAVSTAAPGKRSVLFACFVLFL